MKKVIHKWFGIWSFDKEEKWLNKMAAQGLALTSVGWCKYEFEDCAAGEYEICMDFLENNFNGVENERYIEFIEETGAEHVGTFARWAYFRKKAADGDFKLFSDNSSRIALLTRVITFIALLCGLNFYFAGYNLLLYSFHRNPISIIGIANLIIADICLAGIIGLLRKRKRLRAEQRICE